MLKFLDLVLNKLPVLKKLDGYKTIIGGILISVGTGAVAASPLAPVYGAELLVYGGYMIAAGKALGVVGVTGAAVKSKLNG